MAHYAFIENGIVVDVITGRDEDDLVEGVTSWADYYSANRGGVFCLATSYNTRGGVHYTDGEPSEDQTKALRFNYAGIGFTYDEERDAFGPPRPFESWVLDEQTCLWVAPIPMPEDGAVYTWDEQAGDWVEVA